jgi:pyochelin synthetase
MTVNQLLEELVSKGVRLRAEDGQLVVEAPRGALTSGLRSALADNKSTVLALLQRQIQPGAGQVEPDLAGRDLPFPLTDIQQAYWVGRTDAMDMGRVGCHYYQEFQGEGLDLGRVEGALQRLIQQHDMLRAIVQPDGQQRILPDVPPYRISVVDLRGKGPEEVLRATEAVRERMAHFVFEPDRWPLFEVQAALLDGGKQRFFLSIDLLMIDAVSLSRLIADWEVHYRSAQPGVDLAPPEFSFRDYVLAEIEWRKSDGYRRSLAYWDQRLESLPAAPELPVLVASGPDDSGSQTQRERRKGRLDAARWSRLKERGAQAGLTPSTLLCAVFSEVLGTWSRGQRLTLNLTMCRRLPLHPQVEQLLGDFTTTILLEVDREPDTFLARARRLHDRFVADMDHVAVSGVEVLRRRSRLGGEMAGAAMPVVFTSLLGHQESQPALMFSPNWLGETVYGISQTPQVSLDHQAFEECGDLVFHWDTLVAAFADGLLPEMFSAYLALLERLADDQALWEDRSLSLTPAAQLQNRAALETTAPVSEELLHTLFEKQAALRPDSPAVISTDRTLSYGELDRRSLRLAHRLRTLGAVPNEHVGVVMEKGWEQVVAVLAVLRAGAAYLPIDADLPPARIQHLVMEGQVGIVVSQPRVVTGAEWSQGLQVLLVEAAEDEMSSPPAPLTPAQGIGDLAYTIFTSGSTGTPKGVMIDHRGAVNTILDINRRFGVTPNDRVLALSSLSFDLSVYDIFGLLAAGGAVVLPGHASSRDPQQWIAQMQQAQVTLWNSVPALMDMLVTYAQGRNAPGLPSLRLTMLSGDWIPVGLPDQIRALAEGIQVVSLGGATEASIWSIIYPVGEVDPSWSSIPYGAPMTNQTFYVLDQNLRPCPDWVSGELYIGGVGLALGYWRNPVETEYRFIQDEATGRRLYRTGDLGRYLPDGNIEMLGRVDLQVKVQGHRIELGEVEAVLGQLESVKTATVVAQTSPQGQKQLVAYVVPAEETAADDGELAAWWRRHLEAQLPSYMVPAAFVQLSELPLTGNGKVDRGRLPEVAAASAGATAGNGAARPADEIEELVIGVVREVLETEGACAQDSFQDLGCTSLHVIRMTLLLREALNRDIPIAAMFSHPTPAALAGFLRSDEGEEEPTRPDAVRRKRAPMAERRKRISREL